MMQHWISSVLGTGRTAKRAPSPVGELGQHIPPHQRYCVPFGHCGLLSWAHTESLIDDASVFHFGTLSLTDEPVRFRVFSRFAALGCGASGELTRESTNRIMRTKEENNGR